MKSALVTGSAGFLGQHLAEALMVRGVRVTGLDRRNSFFGDSTVVADVEDLASVERIIAENEIDTVFHLAAVTQVSIASAYPIGACRTNILGTANVLEACRRQGVARIICASSDKSYGDGPAPYVEGQPLGPQGIYATSKACGDFIATSYAREYEMSVAVVRCGNLYGHRHMNWSTLIPSTIRSYIRNERPVLRSDGTPLRDYLHVLDAVAGYIALAESGRAGAWNFGTETPTSALALVEMIRSYFGSDLTPDIQATATGEIQAQWLDCTKARSELGWSARSLQEGLSATIPWYVKVLEGEKRV